MSTPRINKFSLLPFVRTLQCCEVCHFSFLVRTVVKWWQQHHRSGPESCIPSTEKSSSKSQKMNGRFVTRDSLAGGQFFRAHSHRQGYQMLGDPSALSYNKHGSCCVFFYTFFEFLLKIMFFLLGLAKILIPHTTASFFPG